MAAPAAAPAAGRVVPVLLAVPRLDPAVPLTAALLLSVFSSNWEQLGVPIGPDRPLVLLGLLAVAWRALPGPGSRPLPPLRPVHWGLAALSLYAVGSALVAGTLYQREPLFALADKLGIVSFALFLVAPVVWGTARERDLLLGGLVGLGGYLGLTALFETVELRALVVPGYINDPSVGIHTDRARGPFVEAAANGLALYVCAVACAVGLATWRDRRAQAVAAAVAVLCALGLVFTLTRQVWLGGTVATLVTLAAVPGLRRHLVPALAGGVLAVALALAFVPGLQAQTQERGGSKLPVYDRLNSNAAALRMVADRPLAGVGWYRFGATSEPYYRLADGYPLSTVPRPHSVFLSTAVELGLVGFLAWLVLLIAGVGGAVVRRGPPELEPWRWGLLAIALNWALIANFTPLGYAFPNTVVWLWAGVAAGAGIHKRVLSTG